MSKLQPPTKCRYCGSEVKLDSTATIYNGMDYGLAYICQNRICNSYVGVHFGTINPKGILANKELRDFRRQAKDLFDKYCQEKEMTIAVAYNYLSKDLGIESKECRITLLDEHLIKKFIKLLGGTPKNEVVASKHGFQNPDTGEIVVSADIVELIKYQTEQHKLSEQRNKDMIASLKKQMRENGVTKWTAPNGMVITCYEQTKTTTDKEAFEHDHPELTDDYKEKIKGYQTRNKTVALKITLPKGKK